ncbi:hypothetical protein [Streptomyces griseorubiginosus]|uniref:hypothetical protein n=1 Tax=Streptomyces griseorubiginosus TaxID=67304 RepID=UPI0036EF9A4A
MSPSSSASGPPRAADVVNEDIRALVRGAGRRLTDEERAVYEQLVVEWAAAVQREIVEAA